MKRLHLGCNHAYRNSFTSSRFFKQLFDRINLRSLLRPDVWHLDLQQFVCICSAMWIYLHCNFYSLSWCFDYTRRFLLKVLNFSHTMQRTCTLTSEHSGCGRFVSDCFFFSNIASSCGLQHTPTPVPCDVLDQGFPTFLLRCTPLAFWQMSMHPFSISTNYHVPLQHFDRWTRTFEISHDKIFCHDYSWMYLTISI